MKTDKAQFDAVLERLVNSPPQKTEEIRIHEKAEKPKPSQQSEKQREEA